MKTLSKLFLAIPLGLSYLPLVLSNAWATSTPPDPPSQWSKAWAPPSHREILINTGNCEGCSLRGEIFRWDDLRGVNLTGADLWMANLGWANLSKSTLRESNLQGVDLFEANLADADLDKANLTDADLTGADLTGSDLTGAILIKTNFTSATIRNSQLEKGYLCFTTLPDGTVSECILAGANLTDVDLAYANLGGADLRGANLTGVDLWRANLRSANLDNAIFCNTTMPDGTENNSGCDLGQMESTAPLDDLRKLRNTGTCVDCSLEKVNLVNADLTGVNLTGADLTGANLSRTNLSGANLTGADLTDASLLGAYLPDTNLSGADLSGANLEWAKYFEAAVFCNTSMPDGTINNSGCKSTSATPQPSSETATPSVLTAGSMGPRQLVLFFDQGSWADIRDSRSRQLLRESVGAGTTVKLEGDPPFSVFVGNAQGVRYWYLGEEQSVQPHSGESLFGRIKVGTIVGE